MQPLHALSRNTTRIIAQVRDANSEDVVHLHAANTKQRDSRQRVEVVFRQHVGGQSTSGHYANRKYLHEQHTGESILFW